MLFRLENNPHEIHNSHVGTEAMGTNFIHECMNAYGLLLIEGSYTAILLLYDVHTCTCMHVYVYDYTHTKVFFLTYTITVLCV